MIIKFKCSNVDCNIEFSKTEEQIYNEKQPMRYCWKCGHKLQVVNLNEIVDKEIQERAENYIDTWLNTLGIEGTIELIERNGEYACSRLYTDILRKRGIIK